MRRIAATLTLILVLGAWLATSAPGDGGPTDDYLVRAYFDNAGFLVQDEEVRIAGANVGTISEVDVSRPDEPVRGSGEQIAGKAAVVLSITDPGFQDFRTDASCLVRPQSLLGEKFVECRPTQPRSSLSDPPPELDVIEEGEIGEGQRFLPLENNGKAVDLDLVNNISREPEVDRFRLILNDLGAGLAARGRSLGEVLERANPALQETDKVLAILAEQNRGLAQLAKDSDTVLAPLARERDSIAGFINNAATTGEAAAERRADIEQGFIEFPPALRELESTMVELRRFAEQAQPVAADLRVAAPSVVGATEALDPFATAGTKALTTLGDAAEASQNDLVASSPVVKDLRKLAKATTPGVKNLDKLLNTLRRTGGLDELYGLIVNFGSAINGYDDFGHFIRASIQINNCLDLVTSQVTGCGATWTGSNSASSAAISAANPTDPDDIIDPPTSGSASGDASGKGRPDKGNKRGGDQTDLQNNQDEAAGALLDFLTEDVAP